MHHTTPEPSDSPTPHSRPPQREFKSRGSFVVRCQGCQLPELNCLCPYRVEAQSHSQVWLLTHPYEHFKPTNTGRLIRDVLPETRVFTWYRTAPDPELLALLADPRYAPCIIFPDDQPDYAHRVVDMDAVTGGRHKGDDRKDDEDEGNENKVPAFLIIDGTWRQARRMFRRSAYLENLPVLPLATQRLTRYRLRKPASDAHLCTAEVAVEVLRQAGDTQAAEVLDDYFDVFNDCYASSRRYKSITAPTPAMQRLLALGGS